VRSAGAPLAAVRGSVMCRPYLDAVCQTAGSRTALRPVQLPGRTVLCSIAQANGFGDVLLLARRRVLYQALTTASSSATVGRRTGLALAACLKPIDTPLAGFASPSARRHSRCRGGVRVNGPVPMTGR